MPRKLARLSNMSPKAFIAVLLAPLVAAATAVPQPSEIKTFKDWSVGCDNGGICTAVSLAPNDSGAFDRWDGPITVVRTAGQDDVFKIRVLVEVLDIDRYKMIVDGKLVDTGPIVKGDHPIEIVGQDARKVAKAIAEGNQLQVTDPDGKNLTSVSLAGSSAALRYMDARQKRAGTRSALIAKGRRDFRPLKASIPLIAVDQWEKSELIPETADLVNLAENSDCKDERFGVVEDQVFPLGKRDGKLRALALISCGSGAYNFASRAYIGEYDDSGRGTKGWKFTAAEFDLKPVWGGDGKAPLLVNAYWTADDQLLGSYNKGRGLGDCGSAERYVWDGKMFRLIEATRMNECRGALEWITVWRAKYRKVEKPAEQTASLER